MPRQMGANGYPVTYFLIPHPDKATRLAWDTLYAIDYGLSVVGCIFTFFFRDIRMHSPNAVIPFGIVISEYGGKR